MDEILVDGKKYIASKQAAKITGYAKDYVGQLCREGRVPARLVGRSWYVLESAIQDHRFGTPNRNDHEDIKSKKKIKANLQDDTPSSGETVGWESPRYEVVEEPALPIAPQQHIEATWQEWFNLVAEKKTSEEDELIAQPERDEPYIQEREKEESGNAIDIPIRLAPSHYSYTPEKNTKRNKRGIRRAAIKILRMLTIFVTAIIIVITIINTDIFDKYTISFMQDNYFSGISIYKK